MKNASIAAFIIILAIIGGLIWYQNQDANPSDQTATTTASTSTIPDTWARYSSDNLSFRHPSSADISKEAGQIKIQILGDNNEPNTEVTDGITAWIRTQERTDSEDIQAVAQAVFNEKRKTADGVVASSTPAAFAGKDGYAFALRNRLGGVTNYRIIPTERPKTVLITHFVVTDQGRDAYVATLADIVQSIQISSKSKNETPDQTVSTSTDDSQDKSLARACEQEGGNWLPEYSECEGVREGWCQKQKGSFNSCASACRHDANAQMCTQQCVLVCSF